MSKEQKNRVKQFKRIVMSFADFKDAVDISDYIISNELHSEFEKNKLILSAMNCSMIMAYCRPFSGNDSRNERKIPDLGDKALKKLDTKELILHKSVINDRNKLLAHSDSEAVNLKFIINEIGRHTMLQPIRNWNTAPLNEETLVLFNALANKLLSYVATARNDIEDEIIPLLVARDLCDDEETKIFGLNAHNK